MVTVKIFRALALRQSGLERKSEHCPDPNGRVDKNTNREFPYKKVAVE